MIAELLNREFVLDRLREVRTYLEAEKNNSRRRGAPLVEDLSDQDYEKTLAHLRETEEREVRASSGQPGFDPPPAERRDEEVETLDDISFFSRDPIINILQSALEQYYEEHENKSPEEEVVETEPPSSRRATGEDEDIPVTICSLAGDGFLGGDGRRVLDKFSLTDPGWVSSKMAEGIRWFRGKREFNVKPPPPLEIHERARLVMAGDWASGLPRAQKVATGMRRSVEEGLKEGREVHVIHLGDVYYSGWEREYRKRFLPYWPVRPEESGRVGSWCLNANHDMYSGGHAYYDFLLADRRFERQSKSSFFELYNRHWQILSLDTGWEEGDLKDPQSEWVESRVADACRKVMLLSHHQLFSSYESGSELLRERLGRVLEADRIRAWFWGHEHRCMLYKPHQKVAFARCVGHGGVPVYMFHGEDESYPDPGAYEYRAFFRKGLEPWALMGYVVLDFEGPRLHVRYIDENGYTHKEETLE